MSGNLDPTNGGDYRPHDGQPDSELPGEDWLAQNPLAPSGTHGVRQARPGAADHLPKYQPGSVPNPLGIGLDPSHARGKAARISLIDELRLEIEEVDWRAAPSDDPSALGEVISKGRSIARRLVSIILNGKDRDTIEASRLLFAYVHGMPVQPIEFDVAKVVMQLAEDRGLSKEDVTRAVSETRRILNEAKSGASGLGMPDPR